MELAVAARALLVDRAAFEVTAIRTSCPLVGIVLGRKRALFPIGSLDADDPLGGGSFLVAALHHRPEEAIPALRAAADNIATIGMMHGDMAAFAAALRSGQSSMAIHAISGLGHAARRLICWKSRVGRGNAVNIVAICIAILDKPVKIAARQCRGGRAVRRISRFGKIEDDGEPSFFDIDDGLGTGIGVAAKTVGFQQILEWLLTQHLIPGAVEGECNRGTLLAVMHGMADGAGPLDRRSAKHGQGEDSCAQKRTAGYRNNSIIFHKHAVLLPYNSPLRILIGSEFDMLSFACFFCRSAVRLPPCWVFGSLEFHLHSLEARQYMPTSLL